jgi:hydroxyatrazine ethylaminohydrolase
MYKLLKNAKAIVTCDNNDRVYYNSDILINGNEIIQIGKNLSLYSENGEIIDCSNKFIYPGLINTHHHFFQAFVRNLGGHEETAESASLINWLTNVYSIFQNLNSDSIYYASLVTISDLIKHGCTTAFDLNYCFTEDTRDGIDRQMEAAKLMGIRFHAGRGTNTIPISDGSMIPNKMCETTAQYIEDCERLINKYHDNSKFSMNQIVMAPCQPINCYLETFQETIRVARANNVRMHTHMYEGESDIIKAKYGKKTLDWFNEIGFVGPDVWVAHAWELEEKEYKKMGDLQIGISYCPVPAVMSSIGYIPNMHKMIRNNINISIGCDGQSSNDGSNMLDSLRVCYLMQLNQRNRTGVSIAPYEILKMATINGAKTLGRDDIGSLEEGKAADLFMIDTESLDLVGSLHDPKSILMTVGITKDVYLTMINGEIVFKGGKLLRVKEKELFKKASKQCFENVTSKSDSFKYFM